MLFGVLFSLCKVALQRKHEEQGQYLHGLTRTQSPDPLILADLVFTLQFRKSVGPQIQGMLTCKTAIRDSKDWVPRVGSEESRCVVRMFEANKIATFTGSEGIQTL